MLYYIYIYFRVMSEKKKKHFYTTCLEFANHIHLRIKHG